MTMEYGEDPQKCGRFVFHSLPVCRAASSSLRVLLKYAFAISYDDLNQSQSCVRASGGMNAILPTDGGAWHGGDDPRLPAPQKSSPTKLSLDDLGSVEKTSHIPDILLLT